MASKIKHKSNKLSENEKEFIELDNHSDGRNRECLLCVLW
jgi:hypothetical protein